MTGTHVFAESSAVLEWLLDQPRGEEIRRVLVAARRVTASRLLLLEAERALARQPTQMAIEGRTRLASLVAGLDILPVDAALARRLGEPFPREPVRTLDAVHLATALVVQALVPDLALLALDDRVRQNGVALGLAVLP